MPPKPKPKPEAESGQSYMKSAVIRYKQGDFKSINEYLRRDCQPQNSDLDELVRQIDGQMKSKLTALGVDTLYRGTGMLEFESTNKFMFLNLKDEIPAFEYGKDIRVLNAEFKKKKKVCDEIKKLRGKSFTWKSYTSASDSLLVAKRFSFDINKGIILEIRTYGATHVSCVDLRTCTGAKNVRNESEILLARNTSFKAEDVNLTENHCKYNLLITLTLP